MASQSLSTITYCTKTDVDWFHDALTPIPLDKIIGGSKNGKVYYSGKIVTHHWGIGRDGTRYHRGIDFYALKHDPIYAVKSGTVMSAVEDNTIGGIRCWIKDANGYEHYYAHMYKFADGIKKGASVKQGQCIGYVGDTGSANYVTLKDGTVYGHVHYSLVNPKGGCINPTWPFLKTAPTDAQKRSDVSKVGTKEKFNASLATEKVSVSDDPNAGDYGGTGSSGDDSGGGSGSGSGSSNAAQPTYIWNDDQTWSAEYMIANLNTTISQMSGGNSAMAAHIRTVFGDTYYSLSQSWDMTEGSFGANNVLNDNDKPDDATVKELLATLDKNIVSGAIVLPLKFPLTGSSIDANKNLGLHFKDKANRSSLTSIKDFNSFTIKTASENVFHNLMVLLLVQVRKTLIAKVPYFASQQKLTIVSGFRELTANKSDSDDKLIYSAHSCGLAVDILIKDKATFDSAVSALGSLGIPNMSFNSSNTTMHIDLSVSRG